MSRGGWNGQISNCCDQPLGSLDTDKSGFERTILRQSNQGGLQYTMQRSCVYASQVVDRPVIRFKGNLVNLPGIEVKTYISRPLARYCLQVIYSLSLSGETQRNCKRDSGARQLYYGDLSHQNISANMRQDHKCQPCSQHNNLVLSAPPSLPVFFLSLPPSHLPPLPNLYVNSLFPKKRYTHVYPFVAGTQKPTNKQPEPLHGEQPYESLQFSGFSCDLVKAPDDAYDCAFSTFYNWHCRS